MAAGRQTPFVETDRVDVFMDRRQIAAWIKARRSNLGLSQAKIAAAIDRTPQYISAIERMEPTANPTTDDLVGILNVLDADLVIAAREPGVSDAKRARLALLRELAGRASDDYIEGLIRFLDNRPPPVQ